MALRRYFMQILETKDTLSERPCKLPVATGSENTTLHSSNFTTKGELTNLERNLPAKGSEKTTLDRVHMAMLLQRSGNALALQDFLHAELARGPSFLLLANALSALYPTGSEEKRLLEAVLLASRRV